jgi:hypothetical protein
VVGPSRSVFTPKVLAVSTEFPPDDEADLDALTFTSDGLVVTLASPRWCAQVVFTQTYGFRVLDELDMTEFWSGCSLNDGWLFEVTSGGWKDLESTRPSFTPGRLTWVREYLVIGRDKCVSVLTKEDPIVRVETLPSSLPGPDDQRDLPDRGAA